MKGTVATFRKQKEMKYEHCDLCIDGCCYAYACYSGIKCEAKRGESGPVCMATIEEIKQLNKER